MRYLAGIDIGGTKCAVTLGVEESGHVAESGKERLPRDSEKMRERPGVAHSEKERFSVDPEGNREQPGVAEPEKGKFSVGSEGNRGQPGIAVLEKEKFPTPGNPHVAVKQLVETLEQLLARHGGPPLSAVGISCGGPLDPERGLIQCPPNLPDWDGVDVVTPFEKAFGVPAALQNDANACALAEWLWGAGQGTRNMIFLTFGTGLGAGLILDGRLYAGTNGMAGEVGHVRLLEDGPEGYGKKGSFEGFCSGGGIARGGRIRVADWLAQGKTTEILKEGMRAEDVTAADIGRAAQAGDALARSILEDTGEMLGKGLAMLIDILNPERIVIGSIFGRQEAFLRAPMERMIREEALYHTRSVCSVVPAGLGEALGDYAALSVARIAAERRIK